MPPIGDQAWVSDLSRLEQAREVLDPADDGLAGALVEGVQRLVIPVVAHPDLGLREDRRPAALRRAHRFADLALAAVCGGRVNVPVADERSAVGQSASRLPSNRRGQQVSWSAP
jgi:hypothetical protein